MTELDRAIDTIIASLKSGGTVYACGNGGSDAHAGHLVAELIGRFAYDRPPLRAVHLSSGGPVGSCIANDYGWEQVFARQVEALCKAPWAREADEAAEHCLVVFTTSGRSRNVVEALSAAEAADAHAVAFTGPAGLDDWDSEMVGPHHAVRSSATSTAAIQEEHQRQVHLVAEAVEKAMFPK